MHTVICINFVRKIFVLKISCNNICVNQYQMCAIYPLYKLIQVNCFRINNFHHFAQNENFITTKIHELWYFV
jgi:hypothetical protein